MSKRKRRRSSRSPRTTKQGNLWARKTGKTGERIELYSAAYKLALAQIPPPQRREWSDISLRLHASIRRQLKAGETDARTVAFTALKDVLIPDTH